MSVVFDRAYLVLHGKIFFPKNPACHRLSSMENFAGPSQILSWLQFKTMYLYGSKTAPIRLFDKISSSKHVFHTLWTRLLHIKKSKHVIFWPSYCTKLKLDNLLVGPSQTNKSKTDMLSYFFLNFLDNYYSACTYLQLPCFKFFFEGIVFILF